MKNNYPNYHLLKDAIPRFRPPCEVGQHFPASYYDISLLGILLYQDSHFQRPEFFKDGSTTSLIMGRAGILRARKFLNRWFDSEFFWGRMLVDYSFATQPGVSHLDGSHKTVATTAVYLTFDIVRDQILHRTGYHRIKWLISIPADAAFCIEMNIEYASGNQIHGGAHHNDRFFIDETLPSSSEKIRNTITGFLEKIDVDVSQAYDSDQLERGYVDLAGLPAFASFEERKNRSFPSEEFPSRAFVGKEWAALSTVCTGLVTLSLNQYTVTPHWSNRFGQAIGRGALERVAWLAMVMFYDDRLVSVMEMYPADPRNLGELKRYRPIQGLMVKLSFNLSQEGKKRKSKKSQLASKKKDNWDRTIPNEEVVGITVVLSVEPDGSVYLAETKDVNKVVEVSPTQAKDGSLGVLFMPRTQSVKLDEGPVLGLYDPADSGPDSVYQIGLFEGPAVPAFENIRTIASAVFKDKQHQGLSEIAQSILNGISFMIENEEWEAR